MNKKHQYNSTTELLKNVYYKPFWLLRALLFLEDIPKEPVGLPLEILGVLGLFVSLPLQCKQWELKWHFPRYQISSKPLKSMIKKKKKGKWVSVFCLEYFWPARQPPCFSEHTFPFYNPFPATAITLVSSVPRTSSWSGMVSSIISNGSINGGFCCHADCIL